MPALGTRRDDDPGSQRQRAHRTSASSARPGTSSTRKYVGADQLNDKELIYGAINGMTEAVGDTGHTSFLTPEERAQRSNDLSGQYVGIGVRIDTAEDGLPLIVGVFPEQPGRDTAGLVVGDEIVAVDGKHDDGSHRSTTSSAGSAARPARRSRSRPAPAPTGKEREVSMVRAAVAVDPVSWTLVPGHEDGADPPRPVLDRRGRRPRRRVAARSREAGADRLDPRPARQPGRLRQRGRRGRQPVPQERRRLHRAGRRRQRDDAPGRGRRRRHRPAARRARRRRDGQLVRDRVGRASRTPARAQIVGIKTFGTGHGPRRVPAVRRVGASGRDGRVADARRSPRSGTRGSPPMSSSSVPATSSPLDPTTSAS